MAVAMGGHARLGQNSALRLLPREIMEQVRGAAWYLQVIGWYTMCWVCGTSKFEAVMY